MSDELPPKLAAILARVPEKFREQTRAELLANWKERQKFAKKQPAAAAAHKSAPDAHALSVHHAEQARLIDQLSARPRPDAPKRRPTGSSRRRRRADAWRERGQKLNSKARAHTDKYKEKLRALGQHDADPVMVEPGAFRVSQLVLADDDAHMARVALACMPPALARRVMRAALEPRPYTGRREWKVKKPIPTSKTLLTGARGARRLWQAPGRRQWFHPAAIRTIACAAALYRMSRQTKRDGFARVVHGVPRPLVCKLLSDPRTGVAPCEGTLFGAWRGIPGVVRALEQAGVMQVRQPPGPAVPPCDKGPSGFAFNVYWFFRWGRRSSTAATDAERELERLSRTGLRDELGLNVRPRPSAIGPPAPD